MGWSFNINTDDPLEPYDYEIDSVTNQVVQVGSYFDNSQKKQVTNGASVVPAMILALTTPLGSFDPDPDYGSEVDRILQEEKDPDQIPSLLELACENALQIIVDAGKLTIAEITVTIENRIASVEISAVQLVDAFTLTLGQF